jgi:hypothetical protein
MSLHVLDILLGVLLLGLLGYTAYRGYREVFAAILVAALISAKRDFVRGYGNVLLRSTCGSKDRTIEACRARLHHPRSARRTHSPQTWQR